MIVIANDLAGSGDDLVDRLESLCAFSSRDWAATEEGAVLYAIVLGWGDDEDSAWDQLAQRYGWTRHEIDRLKELHTLLHQTNSNGDRL